jgi:uncharacterized caspase-like protein
MTGQKRALIIGIDHYGDPAFNTLNFAAKDAIELKKVLLDPDVGEFSEAPCLYEPKDVTKRELETNLARMIRKTTAEDLLLLYFAGHGMLDGNQQLCLVTPDTNPALVFWTGVPMENINRMVKECRCRGSVVLMLDCCYSGPQGESFRGNALADSFNQFSNQEELSKNVVISAAQGEQLARERDDLQHGIFTHFLLEGLRTDADKDKDGYVSLEELFEYVSTRVAAETKDRQKPAKYPAVGVSGIKLAKSPVTWAELQKKQVELTEMRQKLRVAWVQNLLDKDIYFKARSVLTDRRFDGDKRQSLVINFVNEAIDKESANTFVEDFTGLEELLKAQATPSKLADNPGGVRVQASITQGPTETQREGTPIELKNLNSGVPVTSGAGVPQARLRLPETRTAAASTGRDVVFISYSHEDERWLSELSGMLGPLKQKGLKLWDDREIPKGAKWLPEIKNKLNQTKVAVLLVTKDFLSSDFILTVELHEFLANQGKDLTILWVLVKDCRWDLTPIKDYQAAISPETPLIKMSEGELQSALTEITRQIEKAANLSGASARAVTGS